MSTKGSSEKTSIYIIDRDYRLVHFNDGLRMCAAVTSVMRSCAERTGPARAVR